MSDKFYERVIAHRGFLVKISESFNDKKVSGKICMIVYAYPPRQSFYGKEYANLELLVDNRIYHGSFDIDQVEFLK